MYVPATGRRRSSARSKPVSWVSSFRSRTRKHPVASEEKRPTTYVARFCCACVRQRRLLLPDKAATRRQSTAAFTFRTRYTGALRLRETRGTMGRRRRCTSLRRSASFRPANGRAPGQDTSLAVATAGRATTVTQRRASAGAKRKPKSEEEVAAVSAAAVAAASAASAATTSPRPLHLTAASWRAA